MPTLREMQAAMLSSLVHQDSVAVAAMLADRINPDRLDIYRNTFLFGLTKALQLGFPVVRKLVGNDFFEGAAQIFIADHLPRAAWLDQYGGEFPEFLQSFSPAASIPYLSEVAELEWAVTCALHAPDTVPLDVAELSAIEAEEQASICFTANPSIRLLRLNYPVDVIWRAILAADDAALAQVDIGTGPVDLLIERNSNGVEVDRLSVEAWRFLSDLCSERSIEEAFEAAGDFDCAVALAEHLALDRFVGFALGTSGARPESNVVGVA